MEKITCPACGEAFAPTRERTNARGEAECPACGCALSADAAPAPLAKTSAASGRPDARGAFEITPEADARLAELAREVRAREPNPPPILSYCAECGSQWPIVNGKEWSNCGHSSGSVAHPSQARCVAPPAGLQGRAEAAGPAPGQQKLEGTRLFVPWGKARFPADRFNAFEVGGHGITVEVAPGADVVAEARRIIAQLQEIATESYERQKAWYLERLGSSVAERY